MATSSHSERRKRGTQPGAKRGPYKRKPLDIALEVNGQLSDKQIDALAKLIASQILHEQTSVQCQPASAILDGNKAEEEPDE